LATLTSNPQVNPGGGGRKYLSRPGASLSLGA